MKQRISIEEVLVDILAITDAVSSTLVPLQNSVGRVLAEDVIADGYVPPFNRSAMDGYALNCLATDDASPSCPKIINVVDKINDFSSAANKNYCVKIRTGDPIMGWADTVIKYEDTERYGEQIHVSKPLQPGDNIVLRGEDVTPGDLIARCGRGITAPLVAVLAGLGRGMVPVYRTVKVAFLSTGSEIIEPGEELPPGKVYNSNYYGLAARCHELGAESINLGIVPDCMETVAAKLNAGVEAADLVVTSGGISVDKSDVVVAALSKIGASIIFKGIDMKPGSPTLAATKNGKTIVSLSGNPAAALVSFELIVIPIIKRIMGYKSVLPPRFNGVMADGFGKDSPQRRLLRGKVCQHQGLNLARLTGNQGNAILTSMIDCNALIDIPAGSGPVEPGQAVFGFLINGG